ncbi:hypothetical protein SAMN04489760_11016 [Syntrophus gentianae]|uniref:Uncharacterized protein n=1 Tax=Syntrophus gentianae TaxID=43775 RepID=A0A1H7XD04_9BACT|nr:hypothetical protein [Syntrophus gentianae]SEM31068.1 hypothetical protein SAMN04489760_11016 [Syntrophus gentianae]
MSTISSEKPILPRKLQHLENDEAVRTALYTRTQLLRKESDLVVPLLTVNSALAESLRTAERRRHIRIGLEAAEEKLAKERQGLLKMQREKGLLIGERISRLILVAEDGTERFYRSVEWLAKDHKSRLLVCRLNIPGLEIGRILFGEERNIKLLLIDHKDTVSLILQTLISEENIGE